MSKLGVPNDQEHLNICKQYCGPCPSFKPNNLMKLPPNALFCARGPSSKPAGEIKMNGCNCGKCPIVAKYNLQGRYFCMGKE